MAHSGSSPHLLMICLGVHLSHCAGSSRQGLLLSLSKSLKPSARNSRNLSAGGLQPRDVPRLSREAPYTRLCQARPDRASAESGSRKAQLRPRNLEYATWIPVRLGLGGAGAARPACHLLPGLSRPVKALSGGGRPEAFARQRRDLGSALAARSGLSARARA